MELKMLGEPGGCRPTCFEQALQSGVGGREGAWAVPGGGWGPLTVGQRRVYSGPDAPGEARGERKQEVCQGPSGVQSGDCGSTAQGVRRMESVGSGLCWIVTH